MEQYNHTGQQVSDESKAIVDIARYQQTEAKVSSETSALGLVMSQMNIADRHAFDTHYALLWEEASEDKELLTVLICEIDFFEAYNENYGHQAAAFMLIVVGLALKKRCEEFDCFLAHYKGEKFAILIKGRDLIKTEEVAENLRQAVEKSQTEHKYSSVSDIVTLSIGSSSTYPVSMKILMQEADTSLCLSKTSGSSQVNRNNTEKSHDRGLNSAGKSDPLQEEKSGTKVNESFERPQQESVLNSVNDSAPQLEEKKSIKVSEPLDLKNPAPELSSVSDSDLKQKEKTNAENIEYERMRSELKRLKSQAPVKPRSYY